MSERKAERAEVIDEGEVEESDENSFYLAIYNINLFGKLLAKNVDISGSEAFFGYGWYIMRIVYSYTTAIPTISHTDAIFHEWITCEQFGSLWLNFDTCHLKCNRGKKCREAYIRSAQIQSHTASTFI